MNVFCGKQSGFAHHFARACWLHQSLNDKFRAGIDVVKTQQAWGGIRSKLRPYAPVLAKNIFGKSFLFIKAARMGARKDDRALRFWGNFF